MYVLYWQILLFCFTLALLSECWVLPPFEANTKGNTYDEKLGYFDVGFMYLYISLV